MYYSFDSNRNFIRKVEVSGSGIGDVIMKS